jgi:quercetin dioxygenase-like cupin family protein
MRLNPILVLGIAAIVGVAASAGAAWAQEPQLAPEGRGLLPQPTETQPTLGGTPAAHPFAPDPSGGFSRTVFETDEDPNFKITIRDFSFPPDRQPHAVALPSGAFIHLLSGPGAISVAKQPLTLAPGARTPVPAGAPIEVVNDDEADVVIRALVVEAK